MEKFKKLSKAEMRNVTGGTQHICIVRCVVAEGVGGYEYGAETCPVPSAACGDGLAYGGCTCVHG